jgi:hypothetical protein
MTKPRTAILGGTVLSDGPDPDADPVGYADAYSEFFASNGKSSNAKEAVAVASKKLDSICPGAAS